MPSTTNNATSLSRNASFPFRAAPGGYEEETTDVHNNSQSPKRQPSAFSNGLKDGPSPLESGLSDDSDLPRLSPIRTSSEPALDTWERKQKILRPPREPHLHGRCPLSRSAFYEGPLYTPRGKLFVNAGRDSSDLSYLESQEGSFTATSRACSAHSEDVWQNSPDSEQMPKINTAEEDKGQQHQRSKSQFSSFFDNLTSTLNRGLYQLAIRVERATSNAAREFTTGMRSAQDARPDPNLFQESSDISHLHKEEKTMKDSSPGDSAASTRIATDCAPLEAALSYDTTFNLCGGQDLYEELESLCNEYAKKLNKLRTRLSEGDKGRLDSVVTRLYPIFDVVGSPSESDEEGMERTVDEALSPLYSPVDLFVGQCLTTAAHRERSSVLEIANLVANPVNVLGSASQIPLTPQTSRCAELYVELDSAVLHGRHSVELIHEEGVRSIAELSMRCIQCLLELAHDLTLPSQSPHKLKWPNSSEDQGWLLRSFVIRLVHNVETVTGSFLGAILGLGSAYDENLQDGSVGQKAQGLASDLELDSGTAVMKIQESLRNLMYVIVYVTFES